MKPIQKEKNVSRSCSPPWSCRELIINYWILYEKDQSIAWRKDHPTDATSMIFTFMYRGWIFFWFGGGNDLQKYVCWVRVLFLLFLLLGWQQQQQDIRMYGLLKTKTKKRRGCCGGKQKKSGHVFAQADVAIETHSTRTHAHTYIHTTYRPTYSTSCVHNIPDPLLLLFFHFSFFLSLFIFNLYFILFFLPQLITVFSFHLKIAMFTTLTGHQRAHSMPIHSGWSL